MTRKDDWTAIRWYCCNCGTLVIGFQNSNGTIKAECNRCRACMVRKYKTKGHDIIDIFAPPGMYRI